MDFELASYYPIFLYLLLILAFAGVSLVLAHLLGPRRETPVKLMPYESGMDPIGDARQRFDVKFYLIAILFLVFDVELLFLYPWAVVAYSPLPLGERGRGEGVALAQPGPIAPDPHPPKREGGYLPAEVQGPVFWEVLAFLATLVVAYVYAWRKGVFQWR